MFTDPRRFYEKDPADAMLGAAIEVHRELCRLPRWHTAPGFEPTENLRKSC